MKTIYFFTLTLVSLWFLLSINGCAEEASKKKITLESLLDEMISVEELVKFPDPYYICLQESSYDRASVSPDLPGWFANNDGFGMIRTDTVEGRVEKVMFDESGPGVITRIWITTLDKRGVWRFYFDGLKTPGIVIPAYDLMLLDLPDLGKGLVQPHTSYTPEGKGGNTSFLPIPYAKACKITFEDQPGITPTPKYYHINYRKYSPQVTVETFSKDAALRAQEKIAEVDRKLLHPQTSKTGNRLEKMKLLGEGDTLEFTLPAGENGVYEVTFNVSVADESLYGQLMRELVFIAEFDGKETVWVPLSDFSGGGMGAPFVDSWYLYADGKGKVTSRWLMPYQKSGKLTLKHLSSSMVNVTMVVDVSSLDWDERSLYFHASWRQENGIYVHNRPEEAAKCVEWNFATIKGKGLYMGDLLSLFNHTPRWYGEGDEKIWIDDDIFPSHFGTGTEDYYNSSWAPVIPYHTPFGGAPRADLESSHGYNAFFRTRNLDGIPFKKDFRYDLEILGWDSGSVDYATTIYWYGDYKAKAYGTSGVEEARKTLLSAPSNEPIYSTNN